MDRPARSYSTDAITIDWFPSRCIHAAYCIRSLPNVFDPRRRPWIAPQGESADALAAAVSRCPSGALHYRRLDGGSEEHAPAETQIIAVPNGPLYVHGQARVETEGGELLREDLRMALCRCGQSDNKPFCDNSHLRTGFRAP